MPEAGRATGSVTRTQELSEILEQLDGLYSGMIRCLEKSAASRARAADSAEAANLSVAGSAGPRLEPRTLSALLDQQRILLFSLEQAIDKALAAGVPPQQLDAAITRIENAHQRAQQLLRQHVRGLEQTMTALRHRRQRCGAYLRQKPRPGVP